jgi:hypothetical protein
VWRAWIGPYSWPARNLQHGPGRPVHQPGHWALIGAADSDQHGWSRARVDNIFVERLWRTVKYEDIYLKEYRTIAELLRGLTAYFSFYNEELLHEALGYRTPAAVYRQG